MNLDTWEDGPPRAVYVHIPFCLSKCHYCDFSSYPGMEELFDAYVVAVCSEVQPPPNPLILKEGEQNAPLLREEGERVCPPYEGGPQGVAAQTCPPCEGGLQGVELSSVYFGGGTPTLLSSGQLERILAALNGRFGFASDCEITVEANPGTVDGPKLSALRNAGFNRLSLGVQSFDDGFLRQLGRAHTSDEALFAYDEARNAGFADVGIDLIFALPGQTEAHWQSTLSKAVELRPEHVSAYELSIEEGTRFAEMCAEGELTVPDEDTRVAMFETCIDTLATAGYEHYEVSNYALPGFRSRHNQVYWRNEPYHGFGAGATSYVDGLRARRLANPRDYIAAINAGLDAVEFSERLTGRQRLGETIAMGLRMLDGIDLADFKTRTGADIATEFAPHIADLSLRGLLLIDGGRMRVTRQGLMLLNDVAAEFI